MAVKKGLDFCLADFEIKKWMKAGKLVSSAEKMREGKGIQPSSLDTTIGCELFILDNEIRGVFSPNPHESVYDTLLQLPPVQRQKVDMTGGYEIKRDYTYLVRLEEKVLLTGREYVRASPKSSLGRVFLDTRMLADFNRGFDQVICPEGRGIMRDLWLLLQPRQFNLIVYPGLALNQLRFFTGPNALLSPAELEKEFKDRPLLYVRGKDGKLRPTKPIITDDGVRIHLNVVGSDTAGIVGLRARNNPTAIDLRIEEGWDAEDFFSPITAAEFKYSVNPADKLLASTLEVIDMPADRNGELAAYSMTGIRGPLHFAGFFDNGFKADGVLEICSDEQVRRVLEHGMPMSWMRIYRTKMPEKLYGKELGSHYQGQVGPKGPKYLREFNFEFAAKNYAKLDRDVLVQDGKILNSHRSVIEGFVPMTPQQFKSLYKDIKDGFFHSRYDCEDDELALQVIPYVVIFGANNDVFRYVRSKKIKEYGETRLAKEHSIGLGGHIIRSDGPDYIRNNVKREVFSEEVRIDGRYAEPRFVGTLMAYDKPVDRVHFGLVLVTTTDGSVTANERSIRQGRMFSIDRLVNDHRQHAKFETWSRILLPYLPMLHDLAPRV